MNCVLGFIVIMTAGSLLFMMLMSIDRYIYLIHGLHYRDIMTMTRIHISSGVIWSSAFILGFLPAFGWRTDYTEKCFYVKVAAPNCILTVINIGIYIPLTVIVVVYAIVFYKAIQHVKKAKEQAKALKAGNKYNAAKKENVPAGGTTPTTTLFNVSPAALRAFKTAVLIVGAFVVTWLPYFVVSFLYVFSSPGTKYHTSLLTLLATTLAILGFINSLLNPIIYAWWNKGFRSNTLRNIPPWLREIIRKDQNKVMGKV